MKAQRTNWGTEDTFKYEICKEQYYIPIHFHQFAELVLMLDGEMKVTVNGRTEMLRTGQFTFVFPYQAHSFQAEREVFLVIYTFSPSLLTDFFRNAEGKAGEHAVFNASPMSRQMFVDYATEEGNFARESFYAVLSCLYMMLADFSRQVRLVECSYDSHVLSRVVRYVNDHFAEPLSLQSVAHEVGYSPNYLSHCFKISLGLNFCTLLACIRVEYAKTLLTKTAKSMLEIGLESGFGSERSFHRQFKNITGTTPGEYRTQRSVQVTMHRDDEHEQYLFPDTLDVYRETRKKQQA